MKKYRALAGWFLFVPCILAVGVEKGYGDDLYKASLTGSSLSSYEREAEGKISIKDNGKVELSIKELRTYPDHKLVNQNSELVIETEVNDSSKTYKKSFTITDGKAEEEFTLEDLIKDDKIEITSVVINKVTSTTPTPTVAASPTPASTPTATPTATASPIPTSSPTGTTTASVAAVQIFNASTATDDAILVPGGIISESTTAATPTPVTTASPTATTSPTATPAVVEAEVSIKPETINLKSKGKFKAFITLSSPYSVNDIVTSTVVCEGATAISGKVDGAGRFIATFNVQDLDLGFEIKMHDDHGDKKIKTELTVSGELEDGTKFQGSDEIKINGKRNKHDDIHGRKTHR
ncbi:MAG: hypothetical protein HYV59_03480 [Planctomycetes bacterium]|nr:hypothetical protein [Planctomycetota bacterium]